MIFEVFGLTFEELEPKPFVLLISNTSIMKKIVLSIVVGVALVLSACKKDGGFVGVSKDSNRYFALQNGETFIPNGLNFCWPPFKWDSKDEEQTLAEVEAQLDNLAKNGGNFIRIWISSDFTESEVSEGVYDESRAKRLDKIVEMCQKRGIKVKMCLHHFLTLKGATPAHNVVGKHYTRNIYLKDFGGSFASNKEFFTTEKGKELFKKRMDFFAKRYADNPTIFAWELWNEFDVVFNVPADVKMAWTAEMLGEARKRFPHNLVTQSYGSFCGSPKQMEGKMRYYFTPQDDIIQIHRYNLPQQYLPEVEGAQDVCMETAVSRVLARNPQKPVLLAESGVALRDWVGKSPEHDADKEGVILHDTLFAPFFAGAAGPGHIWYWDTYVQKNNLWRHFKLFKNAVADFDAAKQRAVPFRADTPSLRVYGLRGATKSIFWCRDKNSDIHTELRDNIPAKILSGEVVKIGGGFSKAKAYLDWEDKWVDLKIENSQVKLPDFKRSIVILAQ